MGRFENGVAGDLIDIAAGRDADPAHLRGQCVAQVIAVQIERGDHVEIFRAREHLLQGNIGDGVLDYDAGAGLVFWNPAPRAAVEFLGAEKTLGDFKSPIAKRALGKLHDVALVHKRNAFPFVLDRVADRAVNQTHRSRVTHRFDPDADP